MEIYLHAHLWKEREDFYREILAALGSPEWHGHNLDALNDSLGVGQINRFSPPFTFYVYGANRLDDKMRDGYEGFRDLLHDLQARGIALTLVEEDR